MMIEPSADHRQLAQVTWQTFKALTDVGFTDEQAMQLTEVWFERVMTGSLG